MEADGRAPRRDFQPGVAQLASLVGALPGEEQARFSRIMAVTESVGRLVAPTSMAAWIGEHFGSVAAVERQTIVRVTNLVTMEGTLFNQLRAARPLEVRRGGEVDEVVREGRGDPFCTALVATPEDVFGRVRGRHCVTASNVAKYDGFHAVIVFDEHDPLRFDEDSLTDVLEVGLEWGRRVLAVDGAARYLFLMWNCLWRSGASIVHGHAQVAATRDMHYPKVEQLRRQAHAYRAQHGASYFDDWLGLHRDLGLAWNQDGVTLACSLTPIKEKEVWILGSELAALGRTAAHVLQRLVGELGVTSFNLALYLPPLAPAPEDWSGFPHIVRLVDRGSASTSTSDFGAMELYAASVVTSDPFVLARALMPGADVRRP